MRLTFLGGADEVGASSTLIEIGGKLLLVDAGIRISPKTSRGIQNDQLPDLRPISEAGGPDYILVTHAHTDHTGALPLVVEQYPHVPVLATRPTVDLVRILQADAQRIMQSRQEEEGELPLFDAVAAERLMNVFQPVEFRQPVRLGDGLQVTFFPAGHIAGAAMLVLESADGTLVMSGDVSLSDQRAVISAAPPNIKADALVLESTYGGKLHANRLAEEKRLVATLRQVVERGGSALIPAFALGRAQEVIQILLTYRDELDVPVYVDGMVRAVCRAYTGFAGWLPERTVQAAGTDHLFFRDKIKSITSAAQRDSVAQGGEPAVIVASSGMLTGGASVVYAQHMAGDPRNAILLTGYQDEEAPGRFLQRLIREQRSGETAVLRVGGQAVTLRCELGTYALSAHADESELIGVAETLGAETIMLVHGDPGARHSLATGLRQRDKRVQTPGIGQTVELAFAPRPWALGHVKDGAETRPLDPKALWEALESNAGSFYGAAELARMWWGDPARAAEVVSLLSSDELYFAADWRRRSTFRVRAPEQVELTRRQRAIMLANPDIVGQLVVLRDSNNRPRVGIVTGAAAETFDANVHNAKGRHYPADALLWVIAPWGDFPKDAETGKPKLGAIVREAQALKETLVPLERRRALVARGDPVQPAALLPDPLPGDISREVALLAVVVALAGDGARLDQGGLVPQRAADGEPMEMNQAREVALGTFSPEARLRKVGMEVHHRRMLLSFDFPDRAADRYADQIDQLMDQTGWDVAVKPQVNQLALGSAVAELLPPGISIVKGPSFFLDRSEVHVEVDADDVSDSDIEAVERAYLDLTGFRLRISRRGEAAPQPAAASVIPSGDRMEINAAYGVIRAVLDEHGLYRTSLKQGQIVLSFISPQVGERHRDTIDALAQETGYVLAIHPHPNQQQIIQIAQQLMREAGWQVRKGPGIHIDRAELSVSLADDVGADAVDALNRRLQEQTGYSLTVD
ncbi:MAG: MBL fold metallo-hydrolase [Anaerolineae bacterium]|nr:MBL fold metallo-hydrolase [Anaerolineae bacterium]